MRAGSFAVAPHIADPRLPSMRTEWKPEMAELCGKVGKVISVADRAVKLYSCGRAVFWDIELFDASFTRHCHKGCKLKQKVWSPPGAYCDVCLADLPIGAESGYCDPHRYVVCRYCLGRPFLPDVGARVIPGPTWTEKLTLSKGQEKYYEEGEVESDLLDGRDIVAGGDASSVGSPQWLHRYHSFFRVRWLKSGMISYCRGPPFQDVTLALSNGLTDEQPVTEEQHRQTLARLHGSRS